MRRCRIKLPNRCYHLISRVAHRALEFGGLQAANRKGRYDREKLLWQSSLTLLAPCWLPIIRSHADEFLTAKPGSLYYKYYKKIEKLITKEGAKELSDQMVDKISELAVDEIGNVSSMINGLNVIADDEQKIKWAVEDNCKICAIIKESFTIELTIMGETETIKDDGPERTLRCFDYKELGEYGIVGRNARKACNICPCKKKKGKK